MIAIPNTETLRSTVLWTLRGYMLLAQWVRSTNILRQEGYHMFQLCLCGSFHSPGAHVPYVMTLKSLKYIYTPER